MTKEQKENRNKTFLELRKEGFINESTESEIAFKLGYEKAINYSQCCTQLLCLVDDFNFLTKNKTYEMVSEPDGHYVVIDDFGEERLLWKKYFKILN